MLRGRFRVATPLELSLWRAFRSLSPRQEGLGKLNAHIPRIPCSSADGRAPVVFAVGKAALCRRLRLCGQLTFAIWLRG